MNIYQPTYDQLHTGCVEIADTISRGPIKFDYILGLVRGGTFPAMILSHRLGIPMIAAHYSSKSGAGDNKNHSNNLPALYNGQTVLIVDDIADSGKTLEEVFKYYVLENKCVTFTAVLYYKEQDNGIVPDYYWQKIPTESEWVIFPWEDLTVAK